MRHYEINGSIPRVEGVRYGSNITCHVVSETAQRALQLVLEKHPEMEVWNLTHKGRVDIIEDKAE